MQNQEEIMGNTKKNKRKKQITKAQLFRRVFFTSVLIFSFIAYGVFYGISLLDKMNQVEIPKTNEDLGIKEDIREEKNIINIALLGIDRRNPNERGRSDSIMIATLDKTHKKIKLTSLMRDTYVDIPGRGKDKLNHAYSYGGPELIIKTINQNFDMNIREFAAVDFQGFIEIIDILDGVEINIKPNEVSHVPGSKSGTQILNGEQALAYSRIRKTGNGDYERTERQRRILEKVINKGLSAGIGQYPKLLNSILPFVDTSLSNAEALALGTSTITNGIKDIDQFRVPVDKHLKHQTINKVFYIIPQTMEDNIDILHKFIYDNEKYNED